MTRVGRYAGRITCSGPPVGCSKGDGIPQVIDALVARAAADAEFRELLLADRLAATRAAGLDLRPVEAEVLGLLPRWQLEALVSRARANPWFRRALLRGAAGLLAAALGLGGAGCTGGSSADAAGGGTPAAPEGASGIVRAPGDQDEDGLPDYWEEYYFGSADLYSGEDDPDGDGFSNRVEYLWYTDPDDGSSVPDSGVDTDYDGLPDEWETEHFGAVDLYAADDDPDGDHYSNRDEYYGVSDPDDPSSTPPPGGVALYGVPAYGCLAPCRGIGGGTPGLLFASIVGLFRWLGRRK